MENRFEQMPEEQGWKAPLPPRPTYTDNAPSVSGTQSAPEAGHTLYNGYSVHAVPQDTLRDNLCFWVREKLSDMLDNDGTVRPEQAAGIYAHLAICRACSQEYEEMQQLVSLVESLPPAELPCDYSLLIMQRIEIQNSSVPHRHLHTVEMSAASASQPVQTKVLAASNSQQPLVSTSQQTQSHTTGLQTTSQTTQQALTAHK